MTPDQLRAATGCTETAAIAFASPLTVAIRRWSVLNVPEFLAQIAVESARLSRLRENLNYSAARIRELAEQSPAGSRWRRMGARADDLANNPEAFAEACYGGRLGNGPEGSGDGYRFAGRGLKQLTGRNNYRAYQEATDVQVISTPDLLVDPMFAADSAGWFWHANGCDQVADDLEALTRRVNGGLFGFSDRVALTQLARSALA